MRSVSECLQRTQLLWAAAVPRGVPPTILLLTDVYPVLGFVNVMKSLHPVHGVDVGQAQVCKDLARPAAVSSVGSSILGTAS